MNITQQLRKWGNGNAVRLPKKILIAANLHTNQSISVRLHGRSIVLTPIKDQSKPTLDELLYNVTPQLVGGEVKWGTDQGLEEYD